MIGPGRATFFSSFPRKRESRASDVRLPWPPAPELVEGRGGDEREATCVGPKKAIQFGGWQHSGFKRATLARLHLEAHIKTNRRPANRLGLSIDVQRSGQ